VVWDEIKLGAEKGQVKDCCKTGNKFLVSMKCEEFRHQLTDNHFLKTKSDQRSKFVDQNSSFCMEPYDFCPLPHKI